MKKTRKIRFNSLNIFVIIFAVICTAYLIRYIFFKIETEIVKFEEVEDSLNAKGLIVRKEWTVTIPEDAKLNDKIEEGEKVGYGKKILEIITSNGVDENISVKLNELNKRINEIQTVNNDNNFFEQDKQKILTGIDEKLAVIKELSRSNNLEDIGQAKIELSKYLYKRSLIEGGNSFFGKNIEELEAQKKDMEQTYKNNIQVINSQSSGIVSYELDGLESVLSPNRLTVMSVKEVEDIMSRQTNKKNNKKQVLSGVKVVDNLEWFVCSVVSKAEASKLKKGKKLDIRFKDNGNQIVNAEVYNITQPADDKCVITMKVNEAIGDFISYRAVDIDIIEGNYEGFLVPTKAIVSKDNTKGVYLVKRGTVRYVPVRILFSDSDRSIVVNDNSPENIPEDGEVYSIKAFDEVITTVNRVKENKSIVGDI